MLKKPIQKVVVPHAVPSDPEKLITACLANNDKYFNDLGKLLIGNGPIKDNSNKFKFSIISEQPYNNIRKYFIIIFVNCQLTDRQIGKYQIYIFANFINVI